MNQRTAMTKTSLSTSTFLEFGITQPSALLRQAIEEGSNYALDWHWYAKQVSNPAEKCYCLERALFIDPRDSAASKQLKALNKAQVAGYPTVEAAHSPLRLLQSFVR
ncbi:MAG: hypothetical protein SF029_16565 [bacterium]|nr:hypothetical protein [bacterium]